MKRCLLAIVVLSANLFLIGCADDQARAQLADTDARLSQMEQTVSVLGNKVSNQKMLDILNKLDDLQNQIDQLNGNVATLQHNQQSYQDTQNQVNQSIDQQLQALCGSSISTESGGVSSSAPIAIVKPKSKGVSNNNSQLQSALKKIKSHDLNGAIKQLKTITSTTTDSGVKATANYYLAVAYAANGEYKNSIFIARKFVEANPSSVYAPDALFTIYISQQQLGMKKSAQTTADQIKKDNPNSSVAKKL